MQTSSRLHKIVVDCNYDYFQFMKKDYDYTFLFASEITITLLIIHFFQFWITIIKFLFDYNYGISWLRLQFDCTKFIICTLIHFFSKFNIYLSLYDIKFHNSLWMKNIYYSIYVDVCDTELVLRYLTGKREKTNM